MRQGVVGGSHRHGLALGVTGRRERVRRKLKKATKPQSQRLSDTRDRKRRGGGCLLTVTDRVAGNGERFVAGRRGRRVLDLSAQVFHPVLQVLLVGADHLQPLKHGACRSREEGRG